MDNKIKVGLEDEKVKSSNEINDEERQSNSMIALKDLLQHTNENGFVCPGCGEKCPEEMRGGSGTYCIKCEEKYDV